MPVECSIEIKSIEQEQFHEVDREIMRHAFDIHNTMGRFCDKRIYQDELAQRCRDSGFRVDREVLLRVVHQNFSKSYYLDMLVQHGAIYELKAAEKLNHSHQKQLINYLLLASLFHGKLVNFRPGSLESRFVSTSLRIDDRRAFKLNDRLWLENDDASRQLRECLRSLLEDWGSFLDIALYREALLHFTNSPGAGVSPVDVKVAGRNVGTQKMCLLNANTAWHISAAKRHLQSYKTHILRLLNHTRLQKIHWININQRNIELTTLSK